MNKRHAVTLQPLQNKTLATKQSGPKTFSERDAEAHSFCRAQERIFLREQFTADIRQSNGNNFAGIRRSKSDVLFSRAAILENCHEHRFARQQTFARSHQRAEKSAVLLRAVT